MKTFRRWETQEVCEEEEGDIYTQWGVEDGMDNDELDGAEEGFMMGYLWAG